MSTSDFERGAELGRYMAAQRAEGDYSYDCRWDLADEAKSNTSEGFRAFREGIDAGLAESRSET